MFQVSVDVQGYEMRSIERPQVAGLSGSTPQYTKCLEGMRAESYILSGLP